MLTKKDKDIILNKLIESFNNTGYITGISYHNFDKRDDTVISSATVSWGCYDIEYNKNEYNIRLSTPDFYSYEDTENNPINKWHIPTEFDKDYIQTESYIEMYDLDDNYCGYYDLTELSQEQFLIIFNKIKALIEEHNKNN